MTAAEALEKIKAIFAATPKPASATTTQYQCMDGTTLTAVGKMEVGAPLHIQNPDGSGTTPCPDGEFNLSDGTVVTVVGGKVTEIETPEQENEDDQNETQMKEQLQQITDAFEAFKTEFSTQKTENEAAKQAIEALKSENETLKTDAEAVKTQFADALKVLEEVSKAAAATPAVTPVNMRAAEAQQKKDEQMARLTEALSKMKKEQN